MARRPRNIVYDVNDKLPTSLLVGMGVQHCLTMSSTLVLAVILVGIVGGTSAEAHNLVRLSMIAAGIGTILQSLNRGPVGSGYLCPNLIGPAFMPASLLAVSAGGMSVLHGMVLLTGLFQAVLSRFVHKLRTLLPPEVTGVIVAMVGMSLVPVGVSNLVGLGGVDDVSEPAEVVLGVATLAIMFALTVWGRGSLRLYSVLIGVAAGYALQAVLGLRTDLEGLDWSELPLFAPPTPHLPTELRFDMAIAIPFLIAGLASLVKAIGDLSTAQKINDDSWVSPDMTSIRRGVLADALAVVSAGLIGGMAQSTSSSNVGVSLATGVTSRRVGFSAGTIFIACAFFPAVSTIFVVIGDPVKGAVLIFAACFMIVTGLQLVMTRLLDARKIFVVGAAIVAGLSVDMLPGVYSNVPAALGAIATSSFSFATVVAIVLNLIFRIGISNRAVLVLRWGDNPPEAVAAFMHEQGGAWGARVDVVRRATGALVEFVDVAAPIDRADGQIRINARFDGLYLDLYLLYGGAPIELPEVPPAPERAALDEATLRALSGYLIRTAASEVETTKRGDLNMIHLRFVH